MNIKDHVCSIELSKKLKELGIKKESYFIHIIEGRRRNTISVMMEHLFPDATEKYPAYMVSELGELLPKWVKKDGNYYDLDMGVSDEYNYQVCYKDMNPFGECIDILGDVKFQDVNEADLRARMIVYLLENRLPMEYKLENRSPMEDKIDDLF